VFNRNHFIRQFGSGKSVFLWVAISLVITAPHASALQPFSAADLFSSQTKQFVGYEAISGPIQYIEDGDGNEGYSAPDIKQVTGRYERKIYDFPEDYSAKQLFSRLTKELDQSGYDIIFSCTQQACGEVPGWKLYLGKWAEGTEANQYYLLASGSRSNQSRYTLALYINEFSNQPRIIFDRITAPASGPTLPPPENFAENTVYFYNNSHSLSSDQQQRLQNMSANYRDGQWEVIGFSDNTGSADYNLEISQRRALAVVNQLVNSGKFSADNFTVVAKGEATPAATNTDEASRALNRRVTLRQVDAANQLISDISN
jgi:outer membrane protein OmpA-like peptidoglycan-associated protein